MKRVDWFSNKLGLICSCCSWGFCCGWGSFNGESHITEMHIVWNEQEEWTRDVGFPCSFQWHIVQFYLSRVAWGTSSRKVGAEISLNAPGKNLNEALEFDLAVLPLFPAVEIDTETWQMTCYNMAVSPRDLQRITFHWNPLDLLSYSLPSCRLFRDDL